MNSKSNNSSSEKSVQKNASEVKASPRALALAIVALFIGILLGAVGTGMFIQPQAEGVKEQKEETEDKTYTQDSGLRATLNSQLKEHAEILTLISMEPLEEGETDEKPPVEALEENSSKLASTFGSVYGKETENEFLELWQSRNDHFVDYIISSKNDNEAGMEQARQDLSEDREEIALLLADKTGIDQEELVGGFSKHEEKFTGMVQARLENDQKRFYELRSEWSRHLEELADKLAEALNDHS